MSIASRKTGEIDHISSISLIALSGAVLPANKSATQVTENTDLFQANTNLLTKVAHFLLDSQVRKGQDSRQTRK